jgi:uncharacterized membrane protein
VKRRWLRQALIAASILAYAVLAHYSNANPSARPLGAVLALAPLLLAVSLAARRSAHPLIAGALLAPACTVALILSWHYVESNFALVILLQQCGAYLTLAVIFGRSLGCGQIALCTRWATALQGPLPPKAQRYTRAVTTAWTIFFFSIGALSALLYSFAPLRVWSVFSNFLILPLAALMFIGEYALRQRLLPSMRTITLADTARAYFRSPAGGAAPRW